MNVLDVYAHAVLDGEVPAGKYHRLACARHLRDRAREGTSDFPYRFNLKKAERFFRFASRLKHYKGEWAGQFIELQPHQLFRLGSLFGWEHQATGLRRFRTAYNEIPRKNGKSLEAAVVALYVTFFDGEPGAEGYCIATKRDQARIVFIDDQRLVKAATIYGQDANGQSIALSGLGTSLMLRVGKIERERDASRLMPLGADHDSTDGLNPSLIIMDEFAAQKTRGLIDVMETATGARQQPLTFQITTAGNDPVSPGGDQHDYACKILDGIIEDETFFAFIAHADPEDDWLDELTWIKANPNWAVSVNPDDMRALAAKAKQMPAAAASFKQKRLNLWVNAFELCLSVEGWRQGQSDWSEDELAGEACYVGVDLASQIDLCALSFVFPPTEHRPRWRVLQRIWTPAETLADRAHRDRAPYQVWVDQGWLRVSPGTAIDHDLVRQAILEVRDRFSIRKIGVDPWHADQPIQRLRSEDGFSAEDVITVPQTYEHLSGACSKVQAWILAGIVDARRCPVTAWCVSNVVGKPDGKDNLLFLKGRSRGRIDPIMSMTIAIALWLRWPTLEQSTYETHDLLIV